MTRVVLVLLVGAAAVSTSAIWVRLALEHASGSTEAASLVLAALRLALAALIVSPGVLGLASVPAPARRLTWLAGAALALHFATWLPSLTLTSVAISVALTNSHPLWLALFGVFFLKDHYRASTWVALAISLLGTLLVAFEPPSSLGGFWGTLLALVSGVAFASYMQIGQNAQRAGAPAPAYLAGCYLTAALLLIPLPLIFQGQYLNHAPAFYGYAILLAVVPQLIGHSSFNWALGHASPLWVSQAVLLEPWGAGILAWIIFGEVPSAQTLAGMVLLLAGFSLSLRK